MFDLPEKVGQDVFSRDLDVVVGVREVFSLAKKSRLSASLLTTHAMSGDNLQKTVQKIRQVAYKLKIWYGVKNSDPTDKMTARKWRDDVDSFAE